MQALGLILQNSQCRTRTLSLDSAFLKRQRWPFFQAEPAARSDLLSRAYTCGLLSSAPLLMVLQPDVQLIGPKIPSSTYWPLVYAQNYQVGIFLNPLDISGDRNSHLKFRKRSKMPWAQAGATLHCLTQGQNRTLHGPLFLAHSQTQS